MASGWTALGSGTYAVSGRRRFPANSRQSRRIFSSASRIMPLESQRLGTCSVGRQTEYSSRRQSDMGRTQFDQARSPSSSPVWRPGCLLPHFSWSNGISLSERCNRTRSAPLRSPLALETLGPRTLGFLQAWSLFSECNASLPLRAHFLRLELKSLIQERT